MLCITYTNAAANEIKSRIGNTSLVITSTIHDALWSMISNQRKALRTIHRYNVGAKILETEESFKAADKGRPYAWFIGQSDVAIRSKFISHVLDKDFIDRYYDCKRNKKLKSLASEVESFGYTFNRNQGKFECTVDNIIKISRLIRAKDKIDSTPNIKVNYDSMRNSDALHRMKFSHDTLLEYTLALCTKYPFMMDIIIDKYPYVFVDEFQDTSPTVIKLLNKLSLRADERKRSICIGYFGDPIQGIYNKGVGKRLKDYHSNLTSIKKSYNRRSYEEIIEVFDKLRNDDLSQVSIYDDCTSGSFKYYTAKIDSEIKTSEFIQSFLSEIENEMSLCTDDNICCLVLKNDTIAELSGFADLYKILGELFNYNEKAKLIINSDLNKLNSFVRDLYNIVGLILQKDITNSPLRKILPDKYMDITLKSAVDHIKEIRSISFEPNADFSETIKSLFSDYPSYSKSLQSKIDDAFYICQKDYTWDNFINKVSEDISESTFKDANVIYDIIDRALRVDNQQFINWYEYISGNSNKREKFITSHNSKGLEYNNVVVFLQDDFNREKEYISSFFNDPDNEVFQERRNLIYVSLSRAIKNLVVCFLYRDHKPSDKSAVFLGQAQEWSIKSSEE